MFDESLLCFTFLCQPISVSDQEILGMILFPVVNEACRVLEEEVVVRASDLDVASVLGMSFPSYRLVFLTGWAIWPLCVSFEYA